MGNNLSESPDNEHGEHPPAGTGVYSVKRLVGEIRALLEGHYREIWVEGEISNLAQPASGHRYFSLKEGDTLIRCALFNSRQRQSATPPAEGMQALVRGRISVYEPRGDMQLIVSYLEDAGEGALRWAFEALKRKLSAEGLFDERHKQPLPAYPKAIGIISSTSGAALHDIRVTLKRRYPVARLIVYPVLVQGAGAPDSIIDMLAVANRRRETDLLILSRGGGSAEDLQPFNDEGVARGIFASALPVVSAVGHEIDFTIADLVADLRAATPTAAAEAVSPELTQLHQTIRRATSALRRIAQRTVDAQGQNLDYTSARLIHPLQRIESAGQSLQGLMNALGYLVTGRLDRQWLRLEKQTAELRLSSPRARLTENLRRIKAMRAQLVGTATAATATQTVEHLANKLKLMSPTHTLERGYAILQDEHQAVVVDAGKTRKGQPLTASVARGKIRCVVESVLEK